AGPLRAQGLLSRLGQGFNLGVTGLNQWLSQGVIRRLVLVTGVLLLALSIVWALTPKAEYLPEGEEPVTFSFLFPPPGYNLAQMQQYDREINQWLAPYVDVDPGAYGAGEAAVPSLSMLFSFASADMIMLGARTTRTDEINDLMAIIVSRFSQYPGMFAFSTRGSIISGNDGGTRSVELEISGPDLEPLFAAGGLAFVTALQALDNPQIRPAPSSLTLGQPMLEIHPDWERAADLGITAEELGYLMWAYTDGAYVDDFYLADKKLDMFLYSSGGSVRNPDDLRNLPIYSSTGGIVPLSAVARIEESVNTEVIRRVDGERTITLSIISPRDVPLETAVEIIQRDVIEALHQSGQIADSISMEIVGASDKLQATRSALASNLILAVVLSYLLMVAIFRHWGYPLLIMLTVPLGLGGGILGLWLMNLLPSVNQPFDMITMLGFLVLVGIVVNNPILLVTRALDNTRKGMAVAEAVLESTRTRIRPILMTTLTTIGGLAPLVFIPRAGTELYRGLGIIVLFGLLFSTLLTLTFMPALLSLLLQLGERWGARKRLGAA
ncbi:MAG: efflux RND transporter permease subunit, partial [Gammaproteobacteria bacterium]|nr:efflux RND transporter permease subunit [Gammaproteobacteria bacterium]